jgi:hypothetical protein
MVFLLIHAGGCARHRAAASGGRADQEEAAKLTAGNPFGDYRVFQQRRACDVGAR